MYDIHIDRTHNLVEATLGGMMTIDEVAAYIVDLKRAFVMNKLHSYSMIVDVTNCPIQQQSMIQAMGSHMATMPKATALAVVVGSSLARMQVRRLFTQPYARIVSTTEEGRAWVLSGTEPTIH